MDEKTRPDPPASAFVTDLELTIRGIDYSAQKQGRESGKLRFTAIGTGFAYKSSDVDAWLEAESGTTDQRGKFILVRSSQTPPAARATVTPPVARQAVVPVARAAVSSSGARADWNTAVANHVAAGMSKRQAVAQVDRERPGLREAMLLSVNHK